MNKENERQRRFGYILDRVLDDKEVTIAQLKEQFKITERTARADIVAINRLRTIRTRGGIAHAKMHFYHEFARSSDLEAKLDIAGEAAREFPPGASIAALAGSLVALTYADIIEAGISCAVVTNSLTLTEHAAAAGGPVYLVPGEYNPQINGVVGPDAENAFRRHPCRVGLIGVSGFSVTPEGECVLYIHHDAEVPVFRAILEEVKEKIIIVANIQKLGRQDPWQIGMLGQLSKLNDNQSRQVVVVTNALEDWKQDLGDKVKAAETTYTALLKMSAAQTIKLVTVRRQKS